jgi:hypothetical protein
MTEAKHNINLSISMNILSFPSSITFIVHHRVSKHYPAITSSHTHLNYAKEDNAADKSQSCGSEARRFDASTFIDLGCGIGHVSFI